MDKRLKRINELINMTDNINNPDVKLPKYKPENIKKRPARINELINATSNVNNTIDNTQLTSSQIETVKNKFKQLAIYLHAKPKDLKVGATIRYYNSDDPKKISISGLVTNIEYFSIFKTNNIKTIQLYNRWTKPPTSWSISFSNKYTIFVKKFQMSRAEKLIRDICNDNAKDLYDNIFLEEVEKYKKNNP